MGAAASKRWRQKHPEAVKESKKRYYERHRDVLKARRAPKNLARARALRQEVLASLGGVCVWCGFSDWRALQIDHVNGDGCKERKNAHSPSSYHKKVLADNTGYQLLCSNCNWIKKYEQQEHRWKPRKE